MDIFGRPLFCLPCPPCVRWWDGLRREKQTQGPTLTGLTFCWGRDRECVVQCGARMQGSVIERWDRVACFRECQRGRCVRGLSPLQRLGTSKGESGGTIAGQGSRCKGPQAVTGLTCIRSSGRSGCQRLRICPGSALARCVGAGKCSLSWPVSPSV